MPMPKRRWIGLHEHVQRHHPDGLQVHAERVVHGWIGLQALPKRRWIGLHDHVQRHHPGGLQVHTELVVDIDA